MNEWDLQKYLRNKFLAEVMCIEDIEYQLICWELMFPSWKINDKRGKWDEPSIDFIFYSEMENQYLCVELKNNVKSRKELLSAYSQVVHRTIQFVKLYSVTNIANVFKLCLENKARELSEYSSTKRTIFFKDNPKAICVLMAKSFPSGYLSMLDFWDSCSLDVLKREISKYAWNKEFLRFTAVSEEEFQLVRKHKLRTIELGVDKS